MRNFVTGECVTFLFPDLNEYHNVQVIQLDGDKKQIIVDTDRVKEDSVVTPKPGQPA